MRKPRSSQIGFTITELLVGALVVAVIGAATYRILTSNVRVHVGEMAAGERGKQSINALAQFEDDARSGNPTWARQGIPVVFPHQGLGPFDATTGRNAMGYCATANAKISPSGPLNQVEWCDVQSDGVTFMAVNRVKRQIYIPTKPVGYASDWATATEDGLPINVKSANTSSPPDLGDIMLIYQAHKWALARVSGPAVVPTAGGPQSIGQAPAPSWEDVIGIRSAYAVGGECDPDLGCEATNTPAPPTNTPNYTQTAIARVTQTAVAAVTQTAIARVTQTAVAAATQTAVAAATQTAVARVTQTAVAVAATSTAVAAVTVTARAQITATAAAIVSATAAAGATSTAISAATATANGAANATATAGAPTAAPMVSVGSWGSAALSSAGRQRLRNNGSVALGYEVIQAGPPVAGGPLDERSDVGADGVFIQTSSTYRPTPAPSGEEPVNDMVFSGNATAIENVCFHTYRGRFVTKSGEILQTLADATSAGSEIAANSAGVPQLYLVRTSWCKDDPETGPAFEHQVLMPIESFTLTYDVLKSVDAQGYEVTDRLDDTYVMGHSGTPTPVGATYSGEIWRDIGHSRAATPANPMDLTLYSSDTPNLPSSAAANYHSNLNKIVAVSAHIAGVDPSTGRTSDQRIKASIQEAAMRLQYQGGTMSVSISNNLLAPKTGKPAIVPYADGSVEVLVPVIEPCGSTDGVNCNATPNPDTVRPEMGVGSIQIRSESGALVDTITGFLLPDITFTAPGGLMLSNAGITGKGLTFYPSAISVGGGVPPKSIFVGGYAVGRNASNNLQRLPAIAVLRTNGKKVSDVAGEMYPCTSLGGTKSYAESQAAESCEVWAVPTQPGLYDTAAGITILPMPKAIAVWSGTATKVQVAATSLLAIGSVSKMTPTDPIYVYLATMTVFDDVTWKILLGTNYDYNRWSIPTPTASPTPAATLTPPTPTPISTPCQTNDCDGQILTSLSTQPLQLNQNRYIGAAVGNKSDGPPPPFGVGDVPLTGQIWIKKLQNSSSFSASVPGRLIAVHNSPYVRGIESVGTNIALAGIKGVQIIPDPKRFEVGAGTPTPAPFKVYLDEITCNRASSNDDLGYPEFLDVDSRFILPPGQSVATSQQIYLSTGVGISSIDMLNADIILANEFQLTGTAVRHNTSLTRTSLSGYYSRLLAAVEPQQGGSVTNRNADLVHIRRIESANLGFFSIVASNCANPANDVFRQTNNFYSIVPPGLFSTPKPTSVPYRRALLPNSLLSGDALEKAWFMTFLEVKTANGPAPGAFDPPLGVVPANPTQTPTGSIPTSTPSPTPITATATPIPTNTPIPGGSSSSGSGGCGCSKSDPDCPPCHS
ncbi:MAG: hypothetical protein V1495_01095 [Pseudomonadota bacterium]